MSAPDSTPAAPIGLRERKNRRTKLTIVRATAELTIEDGYAAATIARIAERADLSPRTVSTWFPHKDDILFEGSDEQIARGVAHLRSGRGDIADRLLAWFEEERDTVTLDPELSRLRTDAIMRDPELRARYRRIFDLLRVEVVKAVAVDTGLPADAMGPQLMGGAAMTFLETLGALTGNEPAMDEPVVHVRIGLEFLRAGMASITPAPD